MRVGGAQSIALSSGVGRRVTTDGKFFTRGNRRFHFRGVTYGTFRARDDGALFPERDRVKQDFEAMVEAGFTVVRTYTLPPDDVVELAADWGLHLLPEVFYPDWRYLVGVSRSEQRQLVRSAQQEVRLAAQRLADADHVLALSLGNEIPSDVLRWFGAERIANVIAGLADAVRSEDPQRLVTYANYPTAEYLPLEGMDFLTFNLFLEQRDDFRRYLTRLQHLAGERPLVLGEVGMHASEGHAGEQEQAAVLDWQLETALERGVGGACVFSWTDDWWVGGRKVQGWRFGLTREDRSLRPALDVAARWNVRTVADLDFPWPTISVVVCAFNASGTLDECLRHACSLDYPELEVLVVDDGSTDATPDIVRRHPRARLLTVPHGGLSVARNVGFRAARGELVAYLDSDAYPSPEWPYYLALGMDGPRVAGVGGPNLPPRNDGLVAHQVARAPGGPAHVLLTDDRAEHIPGCNMAFWKRVLEEVSGFDPVYTAAGDDVDLCWRVLDRGLQIGFHPAALVWHHRRGSLRGYLRQQRGYGRSEALVEARHPHRFTRLGTARWRGRIYSSFASSLRHQRIYRGEYGAAAYQSVYRGGGNLLDVLHQAGVPLAALLLLTAPLALLDLRLAVPAVTALTGLVVLGLVDMAMAKPPPSLRHRRLAYRSGVAAMHLLQPAVRAWERSRNRPRARRSLSAPRTVPGPVHRQRRGVLLLPCNRPREQLAHDIVAALQHAGVRVWKPTGWEDYDARLVGSALVSGELVTSSYPEGYVQLRVRRRARLWVAGAFALALAAAAVMGPIASAMVAVLLVGEVAWGVWRTGARIRRTIERAAA